MASNRLIELAIKGLEAEQIQIAQEMADLRRQAGVSSKRSGGEVPGQSRPRTQTKKKGNLSAAGREKLAEAMRRRWAVKKKAKAAKK